MFERFADFACPHVTLILIQSLHSHHNMSPHPPASADTHTHTEPYNDNLEVFLGRLSFALQDGGLKVQNFQLVGLGILCSYCAAQAVLMHRICLIPLCVVCRDSRGPSFKSSLHCTCTVHTRPSCMQTNYH